MYQLNKRTDDTDTAEKSYKRLKNIKPNAAAWIIVAVILYAAGSLIPQILNINDFYGTMPKDVEIVYEGSETVDDFEYEE